MKSLLRPLHRLCPAVSLASGVAFLLAFLLATHVFWCALAAPGCSSELAHGTTQGASTVTHTHFDADLCVCTGLDETKNRVSAAVSPLVAPVLIWVALVFLGSARILGALLQRAEIFGRDGPVRVPPLHSRLLRASLLHRAPPVLLF